MSRPISIIFHQNSQINTFIYIVMCTGTQFMLINNIMRYKKKEVPAYNNNWVRKVTQTDRKSSLVVIFSKNSIRVRIFTATHDNL